MTREGNDLPLVVRVKGPLNFLTIGLVKTLIEFEIMSGMHQNKNKVLCKKTSASIIKIETGDLDEISTSENEKILYVQNKSEYIILDLSYVTCVDSKGCSLLPWVENVVKKDGGWVNLVVEGRMEEVLEKSGVLDLVECEMYPTVYDAVRLGMDQMRNRIL